MERKLKVANLIMYGEFPFKHKLRMDEINKILEKSSFNWNYIWEEGVVTSPRLILSIEKEGTNSSGKAKSLSFTLRTSGKVFVTGARTMKEVCELYDNILNELKKICPRVFND